MRLGRCALLTLRCPRSLLFLCTLQNETGEDEEADAAPAGDSSDAEMDDEEKKAEAEEPLDDKEAQLLKELKMGQSNGTPMSSHASGSPESHHFPPSTMAD